MAEAALAKKPKAEKLEPFKLPALFDTPLFNLPSFSLFAGNPFTLWKRFEPVVEWMPVIEVKEKEGKLLVTTELPGLKKEEVKVHVDGDMLIVEGERKKEVEEKGEGYYHSERNYGTFYRSIPLPEGAKIDATTAEFKNGVLEVAVPIPEAKPKRKDIPVNETPIKVKAA